MIRGTVKPEPIENALKGKSKLGGLSLNRVHARDFIRDLILATADLLMLTKHDALVPQIVDLILDQVPKGVLPKSQIRSALISEKPIPIFRNEAEQLDFDNFGNAIMPALTELLYNPDKVRRLEHEVFSK